MKSFSSRGTSKFYSDQPKPAVLKYGTRFSNVTSVMARCASDFFQRLVINFSSYRNTKRWRLVIREAHVGSLSSILRSRPELLVIYAALFTPQTIAHQITDGGHAYRMIKNKS